MRKYINMPEEWTGEHAWTALEILYELEKLIWDTYEDKLLKIVGHGHEPCEDFDFEDADLDPSDDIPF